MISALCRVARSARRCQARRATVEQMFQRHPECVPEEGDQEVGLGAPLELMEHRRTASSLFNARKAASASVNWMYFVYSSSTG